MTSISATTVNPYPTSTPKVTIKGASEEQAVSPAASTDTSADKDKDGTLRVSMGGTSASGGGGSSSTSDTTAEQLEKQIKQAEKLLAEQQAQLARTQKGQASEEQKAQQTMALQTQIMGTQATLQTLEASLLQATAGSVDTHA